MMELQDIVFNRNITTKDLLKCNTKPCCSKFKISVYRNHSFELVEKIIHPFLNFANISTEFVYSDYDDSLSFINFDTKADLAILWLDISRYNTPDVESFITERVNYLLNIYNGRVLFIPFMGEIKINSSRVITFDLSDINNSLGSNFCDFRLEPFSGTKLSPKAIIEIARALGLSYLPAILTTNLKAIVFDLDNTLYAGVLGEDGIDGIALTREHENLQKYIVELYNKGFFICIASKNNKEDVIELFKKRTDFPLKLEYITKYFVSWEEKSLAIKDIAKTLNIGIDAILFVDDNIGEIVSMLNSYPEIKVLWAKDSAVDTEYILRNYPGLLKLNITTEDYIRHKDVLANAQRARLQNNMSKEDYIKSLDLVLTYSINKTDYATRISELSNKTNQFIFSYKRYKQYDIEQIMNNENYIVVSVKLRDKLSDSGLIGACIFKKENNYMLLEECFISCRALGRGVDSHIIYYSIELALKRLNLTRLKVNFMNGPRNLPAKSFAEEHLGKYVSEANVFNAKTNFDFITVNIEE